MQKRRKANSGFLFNLRVYELFRLKVMVHPLVKYPNYSRHHRSHYRDEQDGKEKVHEVV